MLWDGQNGRCEENRLEALASSAAFRGEMSARATVVPKPSRHARCTRGAMLKSLSRADFCRLSLTGLVGAACQRAEPPQKASPPPAAPPPPVAPPASAAASPPPSSAP